MRVKKRRQRKKGKIEKEMAAAEARAVWQRAANRCFVQEDAKRAPKLPPPPPASSSSSSSSSSLSSVQHTSTSYSTNSQSNSHPDNSEMITNLTPMNWNPYPTSTANLPADTKWWLQLHPSFAYQREFLIYEPKNNVLPDPATTDPVSPISPSPDFENADPPKTSLFMSFIKHGAGIEKNVEDRKLRYDAKPCEDTLMPKKSEPWWRVADGEELAYMVAQKAAQHVENCDLPTPTQTKVCYSRGEHQLGVNPALKVGMAAFGDINLNYYDDDESNNNNPPLNNNNSNNNNPRHSYSTRCRKEKKGSREELLEALCHSQTRAREAEMAAKRAQGEKEDIIKLLFRQASHLFACKQWLKMLQLENLCLQLRIRDHHLPFPPFNSKPTSPPSPRTKPDKIHKGGSHSICRYVVVFAVGLGLAGAGLLFGWTLGWLLPNL